MAAAAMQQALNAHDRVKKSTDLPLFYGRKDKDSISAQNLIDRITRAAEIANWDNDARKINEFYMILRDRALVWWESLPVTDINVNSWAAVSNNFLDVYEPKSTARTNCTNFQDLVQRSGEGVRDYYLRVFETFKKLSKAKPEAIAAVRHADAAGIAAAAAANIKQEGVVDVEKFFMHQLFIAGLREDIRVKVMEAGHATIGESLSNALDLEVIHSDRRGGRAVNAVVEEKADNEEDWTADLNDEDFEAVNAIRIKRGLNPFRRNQGRTSGNKNGNKTSTICRYCKKRGHMQRECRTRLRENGKMVDAQGKPFTPKANAVIDDNDRGARGDSSTLGSAIGSIAKHLNW